MRLLIDTNVFLEILPAQSHADEAKELLRKVDQHDSIPSAPCSCDGTNPKSSADPSPT